MQKNDEVPNLEFIIDVFNQKLGEFQGNIANKIHIKAMSSAEMMTFLNRCICWRQIRNAGASAALLS